MSALRLAEDPEAVPEGWEDITEAVFNKGSRFAAYERPGHGLEGPRVMRWDDGYETPRRERFLTLAEACRAAERAYCGCYVGATSPRKPRIGDLLKTFEWDRLDEFPAGTRFEGECADLGPVYLERRPDFGWNCTRYLTPAGGLDAICRYRGDVLRLVRIGGATSEPG